MKDLLNTGRVLGREEMKKIMAGSGGSCAGPHEYCSTPQGITCCNSGYVCASNSCQPRTN